MKDNFKLLRTPSKNIYGPWIATLRPKTISASIAPVLAGTALASTVVSPIDWFIPFIAVLSAYLIQMGTNLINDAFDFKKGADTHERLGAIRLVQSGILSAKQVYYAGICSFLMAILFGIPLILKGGIPLLIILIVSCLCGYFYTGGPSPLAYNGCADLFVLVFFGIVLTATVYYLETGLLSLKAIVAGIQIGILGVLILALNNLRDHVGDAKANKRTLPVRFGKTFGRWQITFCALTPFIFGLFWLREGFYAAAILPLAILPLAWTIVAGVWKEEPGFIYNRYFGIAGLLQLLFAILMSIGFVLSKNP